MKDDGPSDGKGMVVGIELIGPEADAAENRRHGKGLAVGQIQGLRCHDGQDARGEGWF